MKKVYSGHQPNFIPYMGMFYKMFQSDVFVLDDDVQYSKGCLHNANYIIANGKKYKIIVPVNYKFGDLINEVRIVYEPDWIRKMLKTIRLNYGKAPHFEEVYELLERELCARPAFLAELNQRLIIEIARRMGIECKVVIASERFFTEKHKNERNVEQGVELGCDVYYSGIGGTKYNNHAMYEANGISVLYSDYTPLQYEQIIKPSIDNLSAIDYLMMKGFELPNEWKRMKR